MILYIRSLYPGNAFFESGKFEESRKRWNQILELFPSNKVANEYIFKCELKLNPAEGDAVVKKIVRRGGGFPE